MKIKAIYDNGGATADRYTVVITERALPSGPFRPLVGQGASYMALYLSEDCNMPNGFNQWGEAIPGPHIGKKIKFSQLPKNVQRCVKARLED